MKPTHQERQFAAQIRIKVDKKLGNITPQWIIDLANGVKQEPKSSLELRSELFRTLKSDRKRRMLEKYERTSTIELLTEVKADLTSFGPVTAEEIAEYFDRYIERIYHD